MIRIGIVVLLAVPILCTVASCSPGNEKSKSEDRQKKREAVEAVISLDIGSGGKSLELRLTDGELISQLIEEPLTVAKLDPNPLNYVGVGSVKIFRKDGSEEGFVLFHPWGRFKQGGKYFVTDFSSLKKAFKDCVAEASFVLD